MLLFGEDKIVRRDLILNVHKANGGLDQSSEHGNPDGFVSGRSTKRTWDHVNLTSLGSSEIYHYLTTTKASDKSEYSPHDFDEKKTPYKEGFLYCCKGLLFLDNLLCSDESKLLSYKLNTHIKDQNTSFQWLVIYAEKLEGLSPDFRDQFERISLNSEKTIVEPFVNGAAQKAKNISGITKKRGRKPKHAKSDEFMQIVKDIIKGFKNDSLGGYVKKVKNEMERKGLKKKERNHEEVLIYTDKTIRTYICDHTEYKKTQERKNKSKNK